MGKFWNLRKLEKIFVPDFHPQFSHLCYYFTSPSFWVFFSISHKPTVTRLNGFIYLPKKYKLVRWIIVLFENRVFSSFNNIQQLRAFGMYGVFFLYSTGSLYFDMLVIYYKFFVEGEVEARERGLVVFRTQKETSSC